VSDLSFDDVVGWLQAHEGHTVMLEIGEPDPDHQDHDAIYGLLHTVTLGRVVLSEDIDLNRPAAVLRLANLPEGSRLMFDPARFVRAKQHVDSMKVWMHDAYIAFVNTRKIDA
jgi:hypothetical protein